MSRQPSPSERIKALQDAAKQDADCLPTLTRALTDPCITVRTEAARLLGQVGGAEETARLWEALSGAIGRRSPVWHRMLGGLTVTALAVLVALMIFVIGVLSLGQAFKLRDIKPWKIWRDIVEAQRGEEPFIAACVGAIATVSERSPMAESRQHLGELWSLATDETHLTRSTREAIRDAADRLDSATRALATLPTPAEAPKLSTELLPVAEAAQEVRS